MERLGLPLTSDPSHVAQGWFLFDLTLARTDGRLTWFDVPARDLPTDARTPILVGPSHEGTTVGETALA